MQCLVKLKCDRILENLPFGTNPIENLKNFLNKFFFVHLDKATIKLLTGKSFMPKSRRNG